VSNLQLLEHAPPTINSYKEDFIDMETPMLDNVQLVVLLGSLRYSSFQTLSARTPNRAA
jgi:hypothetical protein